MNKLPLFPLLKSFVEAKDKNESFETILQRFDRLLTKYAYALKDVDLKYDLAADLYFALLKMPLEEERFRQDKYIISYIVKTVKNAAGKVWRDRAKDRHILVYGETYANDFEYMDDCFANLWHDDMMDKIKAMLSEKDFRIFELIYQGYGITEISKILGVSKQRISVKATQIKNRIIINLLG